MTMNALPLMEKAAPARPVMAGDICAAMRETYCQPEWAVFFEVANGTGSHARRWADAVAMNMYPSRGLAIQGFEIKVSRSDWKRELAAPQKAEDVARYCDLWSIVAPPGVVEQGELPLAWGLIEYKDGKLRQKVAAQKTDAAPLTRSFLAAVLRAQSKIDEAQVARVVNKKAEDIRTSERALAQREIESRTRDAKAVIERHALFAEAMKRPGFRYLDEASFLKAIEAAQKLNLDSDYGGLRNVATTLRRLADDAAEALVACGVEPSPTSPVAMESGR